MNKCGVEFIGTFFLMLSILCTVNSDFGGAFQPIAIGSLLIGMIYAGGHISKAHFNPAVTLGFWMVGKFSSSEVPGYLIAQFLGIFLAVIIGGNILGKVPLSEATNMVLVPAMVAESIGTFAIVWVILNVATAKSLAGQSSYGMAIGLTVTGCAYAFGGFGSLGCFNPAVALGSYLNGLNTVMNLGAIIIANLIGGALAGVAFKLLYQKYEVPG